MIKGTLHLVTQDNQPYGSIRKCCEECGLSVSAFGDNDAYVDDKALFIQSVALRSNLKRCVDIHQHHAVYMYP